MIALEYIKKTREYLDYVEDHIRNVYAIWKCMEYECVDMEFMQHPYKDILEINVNEHDISKLSKEELTDYRQKFYPVSSEDMDHSFDKAWKHHQDNNDHHWENWTNKSFGDPNMWKVCCAHNVIDWEAMSVKFGDSAKEYYEKNKHSIKFSEEQEKYLYKIFNCIEGIKEKYNIDELKKELK